MIQKNFGCLCTMQTAKCIFCQKIHFWYFLQNHQNSLANDDHSLQKSCSTGFQNWRGLYEGLLVDLKLAFNGTKNSFIGFLRSHFSKLRNCELNFRCLFKQLSDDTSFFKIGSEVFEILLKKWCYFSVAATLSVDIACQEAINTPSFISG